MDHGKKAESHVAKLCGDLFLKDFVLEAPKFRTPSGQLREVADALLPHDDILIAMQVKTRVIQGASLADDDTEPFELSGEVPPDCRHHLRERHSTEHDVPSREPAVQSAAGRRVAQPAGTLHSVERVNDLVNVRSD